MAGSRRRDSSLIWPGFVDAVTTLLMVLMFVLTIFTIMQAVLRDELTTQGTELDELTAQVADLAGALGLERSRASGLEADLSALRSSLAAAQAEGARQAGLVATLTADLATREGELAAAAARITDFEAQVAALILERDLARGEVATLEAEQTRLVGEAEAMSLALAKALEEVDASAEAARLAAARREALEALVADLRREGEASAAAAAEAQAQLSEAEAARLADAAALAALRERLAGADTELTAMTLALEAERKRAEETLTLLAAARLQAEAVGEKDAALAAAETALLAEQEKALRGQLGSLQAVLDEARARDEAAQVQLESLGSELNAALARVASEQRRRAELEAAEAARLAEENRDLSRFRSEFFGQLSTLLQGREGVRVVGDRFVFSSEVLFNPASADLAPEGRAQIAGVVRILDEVRTEIPSSIDWIIRVDGHTDDTPLSGTGQFRDNWELSQARALSVVRFMQDELGFPPERMAATGFGQYRPVAIGSSEATRAQNRRIELKLTER